MCDSSYNDNTYSHGHGKSIPGTQLFYSILENCLTLAVAAAVLCRLVQEALLMAMATVAVAAAAVVKVMKKVVKRVVKVVRVVKNVVKVVKKVVRVVKVVKVAPA